LEIWVLPYKEEADVFGAKYSELCRRAEKDGKSFEDGVLSYLDFAESFETINRHAQMIPAELATPVREFTPTLSEFVGPRNRVMHQRPLEPDDLSIGLRLCVDLSSTELSLPTTRDCLARIQADPTWSPLIQLAAPANDDVLNNLPLPEYDETGLLGRRKETDDLVKRLETSRDPVISLVGEGGMGKTALAVDSLWRLATNPSSPFDAILWSSLKTERLTAEGIERLRGAASDVLGVTTRIGQGLDESFAGSPVELGEMLEGFRVLIAIDNVESADSGEIVDFYDAMPDGCTLLLTSRVGLGQLERRITVGPLDERSAVHMLRTLAQRRGLAALSKLSPKQLGRQVERLRSTPLAIRWYVEAIAAGADPGMQIEDQAVLLRFCLETIYSDLSELARTALGVMYTAGGALDIGKLAVIANASSDDVISALQDLQRRSLVESQLGGDDGLHQSYALTAATTHYLASVDRPSGASVDAAETRIEELRESEERRQILATQDVTRAEYIEVPEERYQAVAHLLQRAVRQSNRRSRRESPELDRALQLAPDFYEVHRVTAFTATQRGQFVLAREAYEKATELAPTAFAKARVAYFHSWLVGNRLGDLGRAEDLAQEAFDEIGTPAAQCRLAQVQMFAKKFDAAESNLREVVQSGDIRTVLIARTQLASVAKRRVESLRRQRNPLGAVQAGAADLKELGAYFDTGMTDGTLRGKAIDLASEVLSAATAMTSYGACRSELLAVVRFCRSMKNEILLSDRRSLIFAACINLLRTPDLPVDLQGEIETLIGEVELKGAQAESGARVQARVMSYEHQRGYGFVSIAEHEENVFFHRTDIVNHKLSVFLIPGGIVTGVLSNGPKGPRLTSVLPDRSELVDREVLDSCYCKVVDKDSSKLEVIESRTGVTVKVPRSDVSQDVWQGVQVNDHLRLALEIGDHGAEPIAGSAHVTV
jgi:cold shock CspA family protein/tetratricopeptide (TPR) repeat protein